MIVFIIFTLFSFSQTGKDSLELIENSIKCLQQDYSDTDSDLPLAIQRVNNLDNEELKSIEINVLTVAELFNKDYCIWYRLESLSITGQTANLKFFRKNACNESSEKIINLTMYKSSERWIVNKCQ